MHSPVRIATLGEIKQHGERITAYCRGCRHSQPLDIDALIARLGADFNLVENRDAFVRALRCSNCNTRGAGDIIVSPIVTPGTPGYRPR